MAEQTFSSFARARMMAIANTHVDSTIRMPAQRPERDAPPGWILNPSAWDDRVPIVALAFIGFLIASYLAAWQYGFVETVWEPLFGSKDGPNGTERILSSELSRPFVDLLGWDWLPFAITDALLGAFAYLLDAVTGLWGGTRRWRTKPWVVLVFAVLVGPLGAVSVGLVIAQPLVEGAWCTLCLASAVISALMVGPAMDEALASLQYLKRVREKGETSVWSAFWGKHTS